MQHLTVSVATGADGSAGSQVTTAPATVVSQRTYLPTDPVDSVIRIGLPTAILAPLVNVAPLTVGAEATVVAAVTLVLVPKPCSRTSSWSGSVFSAPLGKN